MVRNKELNEQMRAESQARILTAARQVFASQGYFNCRMADIARQAGMSQGNLYWYYPSKEELLKAVMAEGFAAVEAVLVEAESQPGDGRAKIETLINRYLELSRFQGEFFAIFMSLLSHGGGPFLQTLGFDTLQIGMRYHEHLSAIFAQARAEGSVVDIDPNVHSMFFFSFFNGLLITYGPSLMQAPDAEIHRALLRLLGAKDEAQNG